MEIAYYKNRLHTDLEVKIEGFFLLRGHDVPVPLSVPTQTRQIKNVHNTQRLTRNRHTNTLQWVRR